MSEVAGTIASALAGDMIREQKLWKELAEESAELGTTPDESILRRLAAAFEMPPEYAVVNFESDVAAIRSCKQQQHWQSITEKKLETYHSEHGTSAELNEQLETMLAELRQLRLLTRRVVQAETNQGKHFHGINALKNRHQRVFN